MRWNAKRPKKKTRFDDFIELLMDGCIATTCIEWPYGVAGFGYGVVHLPGSGRNGRQIYVHRTAYEIAHGSIPNDLWVLHKCDNPRCFNPAHLFLGTNEDNVRDQVKKQRTLRGVRNVCNKLSEDQVREIRKLYRANVDGYGQAALAKRFGVTRIAVRQIVRGETWAWLDQEKLAA